MRWDLVSVYLGSMWDLLDEIFFGELCITVEELDLCNLFIRKLQYSVIGVLCCTELLGCKSLIFLVFRHNPALQLVGT